MSREMIVIIDETKQVHQLGAKKLPVEVAPFACQVTLRHIQNLGVSAEFRRNDQKPTEYYVTDNGNYIIDVHFPHLLENPEKENSLIQNIPGVIETGFFFNLAGRVITAFADGQILIKH